MTEFDGSAVGAAPQLLLQGGDRLYVCEICVRDAPVSAGGDSLGRRLVAAVDRCIALRKDGLPVSLTRRTVSCLNGCPRPCNIALRAPGKWTLRLGRLTPGDAEGVVDLAFAYAKSPTGEVPPEYWPRGLIEKVTVRTPPAGLQTPLPSAVARP